MIDLLGDPDLFREVLLKYNREMWTLVYITYGMGLVSLFTIVFKPAAARWVVSVTLSALWLWSSIVFFVLKFSEVTPIFYAGSVLFFIQSVLFILAGSGKGLRHTLKFGRKPGGGSGALGIFAVMYALILYPLIGSISGYALTEGPWFGIAPCPLTIFTVGMLLLADGKVSRSLLVIPFIWAVMGVIPVFRYGLLADIGAIFFGVVGILLIVRRNRRIAQAS